MFEQRFLKRFEPDGEGYRYRSFWHGTVHFSADEYARFVAFRRDIWSNRILWAMIPLLGIAAPVAALVAGGRDGPVYAGLLALVGLFGPLLLLFAADKDAASAAGFKPVLEPPGRVARALRLGIPLLVTVGGVYWSVSAADWFSRLLRCSFLLVLAWQLLPKGFWRFVANRRPRL